MGASPDRLLELNHGVGLSNTRARLRHLYRNDFAFDFSKADDGFCVLVNVPFRLHPTIESAMVELSSVEPRVAAPFAG